MTFEQNSPLNRDYGTKVTRALPTTNTTVNSDGIDLGHDATGRVLPGTEILIDAPALAVGELGNGNTMKYDVQHDTDSAFGTAEDLYGVVLTQTGGGGVGAAAASKRVALPSDCKRYVRVRATADAALDASGKSATINVLFPNA
jgi:hypothetical protein